MNTLLYSMIVVVFMLPLVGTLWRSWNGSYMTEIICIKVIQQTKYRWTVESPKGIVMIDSIYFASPKHADDWARSYVSSWPTWEYQIVKKESA